MFNFKEDKPKTYHAMKAVVKAVKEEATDNDDFVKLALTAIGGVVMNLAMAKNDNDSEIICKEDVADALTMIDVTKEATMHAAKVTAMEEKNALN